MRIVGGKYRGKKLCSPPTQNIRPTSERAREAIFNILYSRWDGQYDQKDVLDLFAGTGAFGFEALSRGFRTVTFMDINPSAVQKNAQLFTAESDKIKIMKADATKLPALQQSFDLIFMDAPYARNLSATALQQLVHRGYFHHGTIGIVEIRADERWPLPEELTLIDERIYGLARILFIKLT